MNKKKYIILVIILQIAILMSFVVRYEMLKATGTTVYVPLRGYDPTDIFRGDYVNLSYELPYSGTGGVYNIRYITPDIEGDRIVGIRDISEKEPGGGVFFQISSISTTMSRDIVLSTGSGELSYRDNSCGYEYSTVYTPGQKVEYNAWIQGDTTQVSYVGPISENTIDPSSSNPRATIKSISPCTGTANIRTTATDRWFVPEGTGLDLEKKIRANTMYAEWKIGKNGAVVITNVLSERELPKK